jgi:hypothetical protein
MNRFFTGPLLLGLFATALSATAQDNDYNFLAHKLSTPSVSGTARFRALGGAGVSLGADLSSTFVNPAGLGFYTRSELSVTPLLVNPVNSIRYITDGQSSNRQALAIGNLGVAFASKGANAVGVNRWRGTFAVTLTQLANFNNSYRYGGLNDRSSQTEFFASRANDDFLLDNRRPEDYYDDLAANGRSLNSTIAMYYYGLVAEPNFNYDPAVPGSVPYIGAFSGAPVGTLRQDFRSTTRGGINQWNAAYGASFGDKFYIGASVGLATLSYTSRKQNTEAYIGGGANQPPLLDYTFTTDLSTRGQGLNLTVGTIIRPNDILRIGASITTPTWYTLNETLSYGLNVNLNTQAYPTGYEVSAATNPEYTNELPGLLQRAGYGIRNQGGVSYITSVPALSILPFESTYRLTTPLKAALGASVFFGKNGFVTLEGEYVANRGIRVFSDDFNADPDILDGFVQDDINRYYQNVWNLKAGAEYRIQQFYLRGGANYQPDAFMEVGPKFNDDIDRSRLTLSGGLGYRSSKFYVDATLSSMRQIETFAPYVLPGQENRFFFARNTTRTLNAALTLGTYF